MTSRLPYKSGKDTARRDERVGGAPLRMLAPPVFFAFANALDQQSTRKD
jgi:hypothetical protein